MPHSCDHQSPQNAVFLHIDHALYPRFSYRIEIWWDSSFNFKKISVSHQFCRKKDPERIAKSPITVISRTSTGAGNIHILTFYWTPYYVDREIGVFWVEVVWRCSMPTRKKKWRKFQKCIKNSRNIAKYGECLQINVWNRICWAPNTCIYFTQCNLKN